MRWSILAVYPGPPWNSCSFQVLFIGSGLNELLRETAWKHCVINSIKTGFIMSFLSLRQSIETECLMPLYISRFASEVETKRNFPSRKGKKKIFPVLVYEIDLCYFFISLFYLFVYFFLISQLILEWRRSIVVRLIALRIETLWKVDI